MAKLQQHRVVSSMRRSHHVSSAVAVLQPLLQASRQYADQSVLPAVGTVSRYTVPCPSSMRNLNTSRPFLAIALEIKRVHRFTGCSLARLSHDLPLLCNTQASRRSREAALTSARTMPLRRRISQLSKSENCSSCASKLSWIVRPHAISKSQTCKKSILMA